MSLSISFIKKWQYPIGRCKLRVPWKTLKFSKQITTKKYNVKRPASVDYIINRGAYE